MLLFWVSFFKFCIAEILTSVKLFHLQLGAESGVDNPNLKAMKTVFRIMPFVILPLTINFPTVSPSINMEMPQTRFYTLYLCGVYAVTV